MRVRTAPERGWSLRDYQLVARDWLTHRPRAALFLDMGLGKTATSLSALTPAHLPALIVAPKRVAETVWPIETAIWRPDLTVAVAKGNPEARAAVLTGPADVVVVSRNNIADALTQAAQRGTKFNTVILDELSSFKGRGAWWRAVKNLIKNQATAHVWGLTGTPAPKGLLDLWPQIFLLDGGARLGKTVTSYRRTYFWAEKQLPNGIVTKWSLREGAKDKIYRKLEDICLSMSTEGRIELPPVTENHITVDIPPRSREAYRRMKNDLVVDLRDLVGGEMHTAANAAAATMKLSQICAGFMYVDDADLRGYAFTPLHKAKVDALVEVCEAEHTGGVLVAYRFREELTMIQAALPQATHISEPNAIERWNAGEVEVLLAHPASAGHGLNLQYGGHIIVWTSLDWDLEIFNQFNKRLARSGQTEPVVIHILMVKKSVDQLIRLSLDDKAVVEGDLLDYLESPL